jgi:prepilin-type N-terminal cleavage/methylation domain-containing protein
MRVSFPLPARRRGSSLIEVLVALAIMALLMVGILQMFSVALVVNAGAGARTQMLFKCQQVVENIRYCFFLSRQSPPAPLPPNIGVPDYATLLTAALPQTFNLPYLGTEPEWAFWGPNGANVMEDPKGAYKISYTISQTSASANKLFVITVTAVPTDDTTASQRYFGLTTKTPKRVDYVATIPAS